MATIPRTDVTRAGIADLSVTLASTTLAVAASSGAGDEFPNDDRTILVIQNSSTAVVTVTAAAVRDTANPVGYGELSNPDIAVAVAAGSTALPSYGIVNAPAGAFNNASGRVDVTYSAYAGVRVAALRLPVTN